jgi:phosphoserine phosphatase RsbU/P
MARTSGGLSLVDRLLGATSRRFRTKFMLVTTIGVLVSLFSSGATAIFSVTRLQEDATREIQSGLSHANDEYLENYIDTTARRVNLLFEQAFAELQTTASIFQVLIDHPDAREAMGTLSARVPLFEDRFDRDPNGNWIQNKPGSPSVISVWKYLLRPDGSLQPDIESDVHQSAVFNLFGPSILKNGSAKLQVYYMGPRSRPIMRLAPYTEMAQTFDKLYPGHTDQNFWDSFFPGVYEGWQEWIKNPASRPYPETAVTVSTPYVDAVTGNSIITFFHPLWTIDRKDCAGAVAIDITLDQAANLIRNVRIKSTGFAFLSLSTGNVLAVNPEGEKTLGLGTRDSASKGVTGLERSLKDSIYPDVKTVKLPDSDVTVFKQVSLAIKPHERPTAYVMVLRQLPGMNYWHERDPIRDEHFVLGFVVPVSELFSTVDVANREIKKTVTTILRQQIIVAIVSLFAVVMGILWVAKRVTAHLDVLSNAAHRLLEKDYSVRVNIESEDELGRLGTTFNAMATDIEKYTTDLESLVKERTSELENANNQILALNERLAAENVRLVAEIDVARRLQMMVLPKTEELTAVPGLDISGYMRPADEVGGDYYDVLKLGSRIKVGIGDVTGHGLESGVLMLMVQSVARTLLDSGEYNPVKFLSVLNQVIYKNVQRINTDKNLSLLFLDFEGDKAVLSGQHEEVLVIRADGTVERIATMSLGFLIGLEPDISEFVKTQEIPFTEGEVIVLYTDGITEADNAEGEQFGVDRLCTSLLRNRDGSASAIQNGVIEDVMEFVGSTKIYDDISILVIKHK